MEKNSLSVALRSEIELGLFVSIFLLLANEAVINLCSTVNSDSCESVLFE